MASQSLIQVHITFIDGMHPGTVQLAFCGSNVSISKDMRCKVPVILAIYQSR